VPVVGVLSSWLFFGELIDRVELLAGVVVVAGVLVASRPARRPPLPTALPETRPEPVGTGR
jgi:O-acetylserine/cysteine efflux transporter